MRVGWNGVRAAAVGLYSSVITTMQIQQTSNFLKINSHLNNKIVHVLTLSYYRIIPLIFLSFRHVALCSDYFVS